MSRRRLEGLAAIVVWAVAVTVAAGGGAATAPAAKVPDVLTDAVDPFDDAGERGRFFAAAGVDNELSRDEFDVTKGKAGAFARVFDDFEVMLVFDKDSKKTIDWFEAKAYRDDIRQRVLAAFDADKDGKLAGAERDKANRALAAGLVPGAAPRPETAGPGGRMSPEQRRAAWQEQAQRRRQEMIAKYDADRNGQLDPNEQAAAREDQRKQWLTRAYDADGDGKLDEKETAAMQEAQARMEAQRKQWDQQRKEMEAKHDVNGDGKLDPAERRAMWEDMRQQWLTKSFDKDGDGKLDEAESAAKTKAEADIKAQMEAWRSDWMKKYDADGDGQISDDERQAAGEDMRKQFAQLRQRWDATWDTDGDGELSDSERQAMRDSMRRRADEIRKEMDADGDGRVTGQEMMGFWKKLQETYDADGDGQLNAEERKQMIEDQMKRVRPAGP